MQDAPLSSNERGLISIIYNEFERDIAISFKRVLDMGFRGLADSKLIEVSIMEINHSLDETIVPLIDSSNIVILIMSDMSYKQSVFPFVAGVAYARDADVISICHCDLEPSSLAFPMNLFPAVRAHEFTDVNSIFPLIAKSIGKSMPRVNSAAFIQQVEIYERRHGFWEKCREIFSHIHHIDAHAIEKLREEQPVELYMTESEASFFEHWHGFLQKQSLLKCNRNRYIYLHERGILYNHTLTPLAALPSILKSGKIGLLS